MAIPTRQEMRMPLLQQFADGEEHYWQTVKAALAEHFALTPSDRQRLDNHRNPLFDSKLSTVLHRMRSEGLIELTSERPYYRITDRGLSVLQHPPEAITAAFWNQFKLPKVDAIIPVLLHYLGDRETRHYLEVRDALTHHFSLNRAQQRATNRFSGLAWNRRWGEARGALCRMDFITSNAGYYQITDLGYEVLQNPPEVMDTVFLQSFRLPHGELERHLLQRIADEGAKSREHLINALVTSLKTDTYPSSENLWRQNCEGALAQLTRAGLIAATRENTELQITPLGYVALILWPEEPSLGFLVRVQEAAALLKQHFGGAIHFTLE